MSTTEVAKAVLPVLQDYAAIVGEPEIIELRELARRLAGRHVKMVNSTAVGGGVAEILNRLVPLMEEVNVPTRWEVITGGETFFHVTKALHNALHGAPYEGAPEWFDAFLATNEENRRRMRFDEDFIVIHDPQPVALIAERDSRPSRWVWRCHIDLSNPNEQVWDFLKPWVDRYDASLFSSPQFTRGVLEQFHVDPARPILAQISRFDRLKDPVGVIRAYRLVKRYEDCQLVLAGGSATDDPEGAAVLREVEEAAAGDPDIHILNLPPWSHVEINALQRGSTIVIQKSLREGFGLTVSEALWKKKPVVASAVGGIPSQVIHKLTGMLVHSPEGTAYQVRFLLANPSFAKALGENGHQHVKEHFLLTQNLRRYLTLFLVLLE